MNDTYGDLIELKKKYEDRATEIALLLHYEIDYFCRERDDFNISEVDIFYEGGHVRLFTSGYPVCTFPKTFMEMSDKELQDSEMYSEFLGKFQIKKLNDIAEKIQLRKEKIKKLSVGLALDINLMKEMEKDFNAS